MLSVPTPSLAKGCPVPELWSAFHLGQLPPETQSELSDHLEQCPTCSSNLPAYEPPADALIRELRRPPPADDHAQEPACGAALARLRRLLSSPLPPQQLGPYRLLRLLSAGSMGAVYEAECPTRGRVCLKMLADHRRHDARAAARFRREFESVARLDHPHIVRAFDLAENEATPYFSMEFVAGIDLGQLVKSRGPLPIADACELIRQAALGLQHAHNRGLVHRDVKPSNLLLSTSGTVKVADLGLALPPDANGEDITSTGQILGTFDYMAPEQCRDTHGVDARADLYSLGCTLYHLLSGQPPFAGAGQATPQRKMWAHAYETPPALTTFRPEVSPPLATLVDRLLAKSPTERGASAADVAAALTAFVGGANLCALLEQLPAREDAPGRPEQVGSPSTPRRQFRPNRFLRALTAVAALLLLAGLVYSTARHFTTPTPVAPPTEKVEPEQPNRPKVTPVALFAFEERGAGARDMGQKVADLLFARLAVKDELSLVERAELKKTLAEAELNLSGAVKAGEATKVGQLTGAKILVTGSVIHVDKKLILVAKIIGTETSRVVGASVDGKLTDELDALVTKLADKVAESIGQKSDELVAKVVVKADRLTALKQQLKKGARPSVMIKVGERHIGAATIDPAAQTELMLFCKELGFEVIDADEGQKVKADVIISGEGLSTFAVRRGNLMTVKARLEVKAVDRATDKVLAVDRQTVVVVDLTEALAGKSALQEAAALVAERLLPKLLKEEKKP